MKSKTIAFIFLTVLLAVVLFAPQIYAQEGVPGLPHAFYGTVTMNGSPAPTGTLVEARGTGVQTGVGNNPIVTTTAGWYGSPNPLEPKLVVQGNIVEGTALTFYINNVSTGQTAEWHSGEVTQINLAATMEVQPPETPEVSPPGITDVSGITTSTGVFTKTVIAKSSNGLCTLKIAKDAIGLTMNGGPLSEIKITETGAPPAPPEHTYIIGQVYDLEPNGATFSPAATLSYNYDPPQIPVGIAENDLVLAWWDATAGKWVELESTVNSEANTITALVCHFTAFAVLAHRPPESAPQPAAFNLSSLTIAPNQVTPGESVTINIEVVNTGEEAGTCKLTLKVDGMVEASQEVTINAGASQKVTFTTSKNLAGTYSVDINGLSGTFEVVSEAPPAPPAPPKSSSEPIDWPILYIVIGGVVTVGLIILMLARRKAY